MQVSEQTGHRSNYTSNFHLDNTMPGQHTTHHLAIKLLFINATCSSDIVNDEINIICKWQKMTILLREKYGAQSRIYK